MSKIITQELLERLGIDFSKIQNLSDFLEHCNKTLDERIGTDIAAAVGPDKIDQIKELAENGQQDKIANLVEETARANGEELTLQEIIDSEVDVLVGEIAENAVSLNNL
jgi:hypothetical protein